MENVTFRQSRNLTALLKTTLVNTAHAGIPISRHALASRLAPLSTVIESNLSIQLAVVQPMETTYVKIKNL